MPQIGYQPGHLVFVLAEPGSQGKIGARATKKRCPSDCCLMSEFCNCDETLVNGERVPKPPYHNCRYIQRRTELIPKAMKCAYAVADDPRSTTWIAAFSAEMDRLAEPLMRSRSRKNFSGGVESRHADLPCKHGESAKDDLMASAHSLVQTNNASGSSAPPTENIFEIPLDAQPPFPPKE